MLRYLTSGESHGKCLVAIMEGLPSGLKLEGKDIDKELLRRQMGYGRGGRMQIEKDKVEILSGLYRGKTTGAPFCIMVANKDRKGWDKMPSLTKPRPGHADLSGMLKYNFDDLRPVLERASARETAVRVGVGAVAKRLLAEFDIKIYSRTVQIGSIKDESVYNPAKGKGSGIKETPLRCTDKNIEKKMISLIDRAKEKKDSLGGVFEVGVLNLPVGLGSFVHWDARLDARLAFALMSIQAIKGVEIGLGFSCAERFGSEVHDEIFYEKMQGFYRKTNNAGGLEGGMSNGETIVLRAAMKPIATLGKPLRSVDIKSKKPYKACVERADVCAVPAAGVVGETVVAFEVARALKEKLGGDSLAEMKTNFSNYKKYLKTGNKKK